MKKFIGIVILLLMVLLAGLLILRFWEIEVVSLKDIVRSTASLTILFVLIIVLIVIYGALLRSDKNSYDSNKGNKAHPKL